MDKPLVQDVISTVAFRITMLFNDTILGHATGFLYRCTDIIYLITNRHVVTGRHQVTGNLEHPMGAIPNRVSFSFPRKSSTNSESIAMIQYVAHDISLYDNDENPSWIEHPAFGGRIDVVAIRLGKDTINNVWTINDMLKEESDFHDEFQLRPGYDVFVLGFPIGIAVGKHLPIWKRGTVASEPAFEVDGLPKILIDTATRRGMSGAPVIAQISGTWVPKGKKETDRVIGIGRQFIGVYSSRLDGDEFQAQLGVVWKVSVIEDIVKSLS